uniref:Uncharacterized protein n=1 Tax=Anguilla anguilla TaxID=7936 RepID=A0A0E9WVE0_ANGAN
MSSSLCCKIYTVWGGEPSDSRVISAPQLLYCPSAC